MSKLHVTQIQGYISNKMRDHIDMSDYSRHKDASVIKKAFLTRGLSTLATSHVTEIPIEHLGASVTDGSDDGGIDLIHFDSSSRTLYLVQSKWHEDGRGSIDLGDALKFIDGVQKILNNDLESMNSRVQAKKSDIELALYDANAKFILVLAHTGLDDLNAKIKKRLTDFVEAQNDSSELMFLQILKQFELHKAVATGLSGAPIAVEIQLFGWGQVREPHHSVYGRVCAADIAEWMKNYGARLFDSNLRQFLGPSSVNQDLVETIYQRPEEFWYFNNGITAVAAELSKKPIGGNSTESGTFECAGFSVVNGAQTVGAISFAETQAPEAVARAMVPIRIISSAKSLEIFPSEVTRYTNTQNAIEKRDFVAPDPEQERLRQELRIDGIKYIYKAGAALTNAVQRFDLTEATIALACSNADVALAVQAKREIGKLWENLDKSPYKQLFNSGVSGPNVWRTVQALRNVDRHLAVEATKYLARDALVCIHGNRFIQWAVFKSLKITTGAELPPDDVYQPTVQRIVKKVVNCVKSDYADSYPASLFKNLSKCKALAASLGKIEKTIVADVSLSKAPKKSVIGVVRRKNPKLISEGKRLPKN